MAAEKLQIRCVMETCVITINPPLQIVDIGNGCKAYSTSIYIPAKSELTTTLQSVTQSQFFLDYNFNYTNVSNFLIWHNTNFATLTTNEIKTLKAKILKSPTMSIGIFKKVLGNIDEKYPFSISSKLILALLVLTGVCTIIIGILFIWYKRKTSFTTSTMGNLLKLIPSLKDKIPTLYSLLPIFSEQAPSQNAKNVLTNVAVPQLPQTPPNELILPPVLVPKLQLEKPPTSVPYRTTHMEPLPSTRTATDYKSEPLSLEMFNRAASDLNENGVINLKKYKTTPLKMDLAFLFGHLDPANHFATRGLSMAFARELLLDGKPLPKTLFLDVMVEKTQELIDHIKHHHLGLSLTANIGENTAVIKM